MVEWFRKFAAWYNLFPCPICRTGEGKGQPVLPGVPPGAASDSRSALSGMRRRTGRRARSLFEMSCCTAPSMDRRGVGVRIP
ncbi:MAG: hypothetical protein L6W00_06985 [Lentisphaeria bacterium]|nr:MAG: hypothetical protein L6W00_06985 [Lentisphaeria bacterium]